MGDLDSFRKVSNLAQPENDEQGQEILFDPSSGKVKMGDTVVSLTSKERAVLAGLMATFDNGGDGKALSRTELGQKAAEQHILEPDAHGQWPADRELAQKNDQENLESGHLVGTWVVKINQKVPGLVGGDPEKGTYYLKKKVTVGTVD